jgi:hypothetical protein
MLAELNSYRGGKWIEGRLMIITGYNFHGRIICAGCNWLSKYNGAKNHNRNMKGFE